MTEYLYNIIIKPKYDYFPVSYQKELSHENFIKNPIDRNKDKY